MQEQTLGEVVGISTHPKWKGSVIDVPKDNDPVVVKNLSKLDIIRDTLDESDYLDFLEACIDVEHYKQVDEEIADMVDFFYDEKRKMS
jgi:hypothetical protein